MRKIDRIIKAVCACSGISEADLTGKSRHRLYIRPRFIAWVIAHKEGYTYARIADRFSRDHSTVISGVEKHDINMKHDRLYMRLFENSIKEYDGTRPIMVKVHPSLVKLKPVPEKPKKPRNIILPVDNEAIQFEQIKRGSAALLAAIKREHPERIAA